MRTLKIFLLLFWWGVLCLSCRNEKKEAFLFQKNASRAFQRIEKIIPEDSLRNFVNRALPQLELYNSCGNISQNLGYTVIWRKSQIKEATDSLSLLLNESDKSFVRDQFLGVTYFSWKPHIFSDKKVVKLKPVGNLTSRQYEEYLLKFKRLCTLEMPIFNRDFSYAIVVIGDFGERRTVLFERTGNQWKIKKVLEVIRA